VAAALRRAARLIADEAERSQRDGRDA
jgi:hypothetical protein